MTLNDVKCFLLDMDGTFYLGGNIIEGSLDFIKKVQYTYYTKDALAEVANDVAAFARAEGLTAHARSATVRTEE